MEVDSQRLFRFRFKAPSMSDDLAYYVLTDDIEKMKLFLKQHNFNPLTSVIDCVMLEDCKDDDEYMLEPYTLKSNYSQKEYVIMSNEHMIYECAREMEKIMYDSLIFGSTIIRDDVPIMQVISKLINDLEHVHVLDYTLCDPETHEPYSDAYDQYTKCGFPNVDYNEAWLKLYGEPPAYDDSAMIESITYSIARESPLPFTLEMYVSYFVGLLTDTYN